MSFDSDQSSVSDSAPVELFEFITPQTTYYRTSFQEDYTFAAQLYTRVLGLRSAIPVEPPGKSHDVSVDVPVYDAIVQNNIVGLPPVARTTIRVKIWRAQQLSAARVLWWDGPVRGVAMVDGGRMARFAVPDGVEDTLRAELPQPRASKKCNHPLYGPMCKMLETDFDHATTVTVVTGNSVTVASLADATTDYYKGGFLIFNGERRSIVAQSGVGNKVLRLDIQHRGIVVTDAVTIVAGCDLLPTTCRDKFANIINFGGHPGLPTINPHARSYVGQ